MESFRIEPMRHEDWPEVRRIYDEGIASGSATLEPVSPDWADWDHAHLRECRLVARSEEGAIVGWCALTHYSPRAVYRGVAWESVYVTESARGHGVGTALLAEAVREADAAGYWMLLAGVLAENEPSIRLHARAGFRRVGTHHGLGQDPGGQWRDVVLFERRHRVTSDR